MRFEFEVELSNATTNNNAVNSRETQVLRNLRLGFGGFSSKERRNVRSRERRVKSPELKIRDSVKLFSLRKQDYIHYILKKVQYSYRVIIDYVATSVIGIIEVGILMFFFFRKMHLKIQSLRYIFCGNRRFFFSRLCDFLHYC